MRLIDADQLNGYKFGLISPYAQKLFHRIINEAPTVEVEEYVERGAITENMIILDKMDSIKAEINGLSGFYSQVTDISEMNTVRNIISDVNNIIDKHMADMKGEEK